MIDGLGLHVGPRPVIACCLWILWNLSYQVREGKQNSNMQVFLSINCESTRCGLSCRPLYIDFMGKNEWSIVPPNVHFCTLHLLGRAIIRLHCIVHSEPRIRHTDITLSENWRKRVLLFSSSAPFPTGVGCKTLLQIINAPGVMYVSYAIIAINIANNITQ